MTYGEGQEEPHGYQAAEKGVAQELQRLVVGSAPENFIGIGGVSQRATEEFPSAKAVSQPLLQILVLRGRAASGHGSRARSRRIFRFASPAALRRSFSFSPAFFCSAARSGKWIAW